MMESPCFRGVVAAACFLLSVGLAAGDEPASEALGRYSDRTLVVGIEIDRDEARILGYTVKPRAFVRTAQTEPVRSYEERNEVQIEVSLVSDDGTRYTRRVGAGMVCLSHGPYDEPHVEGDTIRMHRDSFLVELPELAGFDTIEVAYHENERGQAARRSLGALPMTRHNFDAAGRPVTYDSLAIASTNSTDPGASRLASTVVWPENLGDTDIYRVYGDAAAVGSRINIVIVPDGYQYTDKALMESHADAMVAYFRGKTPHAEHDLLYNYILVYAYSREQGTDQCDCGTIVDTAMGTRFPLSNPTCGHSDNRCLSYGGGCDTNGTGNVVAAELRAPAQDETVVMVNTTRYGGCGGSRATYAAGNGSALELAVHELGHSMSGLADEYVSNSGCGSFAGNVNTSTNGVSGAWSEWIADIGSPREGAQYWGQCIYRPEADCEMRNLNQPFCHVCNQHWSLWSFAHSRVNPTAPLESMTPAANVNTNSFVQQDFSITTRLPAPPATHEITW
ncbi:MAG: M64 family metallopeptidase, partial [Acidobacteriota bacterium]|nr:M64 family metallopeptidase [Acidobacteriota bacterium]